MKRHKVVTICGSMRFFDRMLTVAARKTVSGDIVLMPFVVKEAVGDAIAAQLDELHRAKIALSDSVYVINSKGYIGESTSSEINYALSLGIPVFYDWPKETTE